MATRPKPQQGDEGRLFTEYNDTLMRRVAASVRTSREVVEDACAFAWAQFLVYQPDRDREWKGWLLQTARREAYRLDHRRYEALAIDPVESAKSRRVVNEPRDHTDRIEQRIALDAAIDILGSLPPRLRRIAFLRASGMRYRDIGEITGDSPTRISQLVADANLRIHELLAVRREPDRTLPPRAQRLHELEAQPPPWLRAELGPAPRRNRRVAHATQLLAWRRAALAIDDYRTVSGFAERDRAFGPRPSDAAGARAFDLARLAAERALPTAGLQREVS